MRKIVTIRLWIDDDWSPEGDQDYMNDKKIREDIEAEIGYCWHNFDIINFETMEIVNKKCKDK